MNAFGKMAAALFGTALVLITGPAGGTTGLPCRYEIAHVLQVPPCIFANGVDAHGISPNGRYVSGGLSYCDDAWLFVFDTQTGQRIEIALPPGGDSLLHTAVNDNGLVAGEYRGPNVWNGFVYDLNLGQYIGILGPGVPRGACHVSRINRAGVVCGTRQIVDPLEFFRTAYTWTAKGGFTDVGLINGWSTFGRDISDSGVMVGSVYSQNSIDEAARGLVFKNGQITTLNVISEGFNSIVTAVNSAGDMTVSGLISLKPLLGRTFVQSDGTMQPLVS